MRQHLNLNCNKTNCPNYTKCCFLPTEYYPQNDKVEILFVGQGGGTEERALQRPFIGPAGQRLRDILKFTWSKWNVNFGVAFSNTIRDNPEKNRVPTLLELKHCMPFLHHDIAHLKTHNRLRTIIPLGLASTKTFIPSASKMGSINGEVHKLTSHLEDIQVIPTFHPSFLRRKKYHFSPDNEYDALVIKHIEQAVGLI